MVDQGFTSGASIKKATPCQFCANQAYFDHFRCSELSVVRAVTPSEFAQNTHR